MRFQIVTYNKVKSLEPFRFNGRWWRVDLQSPMFARSSDIDGRLQLKGDYHRMLWTDKVGVRI